MTTRNPDATRTRLLEAAFTEVHKNGFRAASLDSILEGTGVTKGALYHHFPNKQALGLAIVDEIIRGWILDRWVQPMEEAEDPIPRLIGILNEESSRLDADQVRFGCPLNNLIQEMSPVDPVFREHLEAVIRDWIRGLADALRHGQELGTVRGDVDCDAIAAFIVAAIEGSAGMLKLTAGKGHLQSVLKGLTGYLETLKPNNEVKA